MKLYYLAKPTYGGWVTFTAHLSLKYNYKVFKIAKRNEIRLRDLGYGVKYQNKTADTIGNDSLITAVDKKYYHCLDKFPDGTKIVIHDPTELKEPLIPHLRRFEVFTIRKTVKDLLKNKYDIDSEFKVHPFYRYPKSICAKYNTVTSTSRLDFDKYTTVLLEANKCFPDFASQGIKIYGKKNDLYVYHKILNTTLRDIFIDSYKGSFDKTFKALDDILSPTKFMIDLSAIKNDGGGTQYTFLEAIYHGCRIIVNKNWLIEGQECLPWMIPYDISGGGSELVALLSDLRGNDSLPVDDALIEKWLKPHFEVEW